MRRKRRSAIVNLAMGLFSSIGITVLLMAVITAVIMLIGMSDGLLKAVNQAVKILSVAVGTCVCVKKGGEKGLMTGAGIGSLYAIIGYITHMLLGESGFSLAELLGEMLIAVAGGAATGAVRVNLRASKSAQTAVTSSAN